MIYPFSLKAMLLLSRLSAPAFEAGGWAVHIGNHPARERADNTV